MRGASRNTNKTRKYHKSPKPRGYWTLCLCQERAREYNTRVDWQRNHVRSYSAAFKKGWLEDCCTHMKTDRRITAWTKPECQKIALNYETKQEWRVASVGSHSAAKKAGWIHDCSKHMINGRIKWTKVKCLTDAKKYTTRSEWALTKGSGYGVALKNGWIEECCAHMTIGNRWDTIEKCVASALKYKNRSAWHNALGGAFRAAKKTGVPRTVHRSHEISAEKALFKKRMPPRSFKVWYKE